METSPNDVNQFSLPDDILSVIPTDPYDQLDLARKITSMAITSRVSRLEAETERLRQKASEKDRVVVELQGRVEQLEGMFREAEARLRDSLQDNVKLAKERETLMLTTKKLRRELAKLETFKMHLIQSLNDDSSSQARTADIGTFYLSTSEITGWKDERSVDHTIPNLFTASADNTNEEGNVSQKFSISPYITPRLTPTTTPTVTSTRGSPRGLSVAASPKRASGTTSPTRSQLGQSSSAPGYMSSQHYSASGSPTHRHASTGQAPRIDGKEFFRRARNRLSYEQFEAFLDNIKEFNAHRQSRKETLARAGDIFGSENEDLYHLFQGLLYRNLP